MLKAHIIDGTGTKRQVMVDDQNSLVVSMTACPPMIEQKNRIFVQYLTSTGLSTGSNVMAVVGAAATPIEFWVAAHPQNDRYITKVSFIIAGAAATLKEFGTIAALANGCDFVYHRGSGEEVYIHHALKTNWDFIRMCCGVPAFGTGADTFIGTNVSGVLEGVIPVFEFLSILPPYGLKLDAGSEQKLILRVNDDISTVDQFDAIAYGFERLP